LRIGFALIDVAASLLLAVALMGIVVEGAHAGQNEWIRSYAESEALRQEVYSLFYSGDVARLYGMSAEDFPLDVGNITISKGESGRGLLYACFFMYSDGGIVTFSVSRKG